MFFRCNVVVLSVEFFVFLHEDRERETHHICHKSTTLVFLSHLFSISLSLVKASVTSTVWTVLTTRKLEARETDRDKIENRDEREKGEKQMDGWFRTVLSELCLPSLSPSLSPTLELFCLLREKTDRQKTSREKRWWWQDDDDEREELEGIMSVLKRRREKMVLLWRYVLVFLPEEGIKGETWLPIQKFSPCGMSELFTKTMRTPKRRLFILFGKCLWMTRRVSQSSMFAEMERESERNLSH